jgi:hypothetical protein
MIQLPVTAKSVRVIGGPMGSPVGLVGPTGSPGISIAGATGPMGVIGLQGVLGPTGLAGLLTALLGPTGVTGPLGSTGYRGVTGSTGPGELCPTEEYIRYYENTDGYSNFTPDGRYIGCKFQYTIKGKGFTFIFFTGMATSTSTSSAARMNIGAQVGIDVPPNAGDPGAPTTAGVPGGNGNGWIRIVAPIGYTIPFFIMVMMTRISGTDFPPLERWFDLAATVGTSSFDPPGGVVNRISCCIFEVSII